jgi:putative ABC transport system substrate-binding protein
MIAAMKRREFITLLGGAAVTWPLAASAQQAGMPVVGFVDPTSTQSFARPLSAFLKGLGETGYGEGRRRLVQRKRVLRIFSSKIIHGSMADSL